MMLATDEMIMIIMGGGDLIFRRVKRNVNITEAFTMLNLPLVW